MAKPKDLEYPCNFCSKWEEKEYITHDYAALAYWNGHKSKVKCCRFNPTHCAPDLALKCPHRLEFGKPFPLIRVTCDFCDKVIFEMPLAKCEVEMDGVYICNQCLKNPADTLGKTFHSEKKVLTETDLQKMILKYEKDLSRKI